MRRLTGGDRGSGTVLVLAVSAVLLLIAMVLVGVGTVGVARHRAASAADLAALAAADRALSGQATACAAAGRVAHAAGAVLRECRLTGDVAQVLATFRPAGPLGRLGVARALARAGPGARGTGRYRPREPFARAARLR
jgi:secretion/DNA translocation related TadE-like protein